jgi:chromosome segregation ATPase
LAVLLILLCWPKPAQATEVSLSQGFAELRQKLQQARQELMSWQLLYDQQSSEAGKLSAELQELQRELEQLSAELQASRLSLTQALERLAQLEERWTALSTTLASLREESERQGLRIAALQSDRDRWKRKAKDRGIVVGILVGGLVVVFGGWVVDTLSPNWSWSQLLGGK